MRRSWWPLLRLAAAAMILVAASVQAQVTIGGAMAAGRDVATTTVNFFSFFTILSNLLAMAVLAWAGVRGLAHRRGVEPRMLATALACATAYMIVTGVVYNTLLRGIPLPQGTTVPWSNEVLHVVAPLFLVADLVWAPARRRLPWRVIVEALIFPVLWAAYTLVRGPLTTNPVTGQAWWYPYPFLNPHSFDNGYLTVALYVVGIGVAIAAAAAIVVWVGRLRGARDE